MATIHLLDDVFELAELLKPAWADISRSIPVWHPRCEGEEDGGGDDGKAGDDEGDGDAGSGDDDATGKSKAGEADGDDDGEGKPTDDTDWKRMARKHEREAKAARKREQDLQAKLKSREDADMSEQEKAIEAAREEGRTAALTEAQKERRADRLEGAVLRLAAKGVGVGDGDDAKTVRFDDPEDALVFIERAIARGDLDEGDVFDDQGKVKTDAITEALVDLLDRKPRLAADAGSNGRKTETERPKGGADAGKGKGGGGGIEDMSVEDHIKRKAIGNR